MSLLSRLSTVAIGSSIYMILVFGAPAARAQNNVVVQAGDGTHFPLDPSVAVLSPNIVIAFTNTGNPATGAVGVRNSGDGGQTWNDSNFTGNPAGNPGTSLGQPSVTVDPSSGTFYLATSFLSFATGPSIFVASSGNKGMDFGAPVLVSLGASGDVYTSPILAVDTSATPSKGTLYVVATRFAVFGTDSDLRVWTSADGGKTWGPAAGTKVGTVQLASTGIFVDPDAQVNVLGANPLLLLSPFKSPDHGATFDPIIPQFTGATPANITGLSFANSQLLFPFANNQFDVGLAIAQNTRDPMSSDLSFTHSLDGLLTLSAPLPLNLIPTGLADIFPTFGFTPDGAHAWAGWFDASLDTTGKNRNVFFTFGIPDANRNFQFVKPFAISDKSSPISLPNAPNGFWGFRNLATALDGAFVDAAWSDNRNGFASMLFTKVAIPSACPPITVALSSATPLPTSISVGEKFSLDFIVSPVGTYNLTFGGTGYGHGLNPFGGPTYGFVPAQAGPLTIIVTATDQNGCSGSQNFQLTVKPETVTLSLTSKSNNPKFGEVLSLIFGVSDSAGPVTAAGGNVTIADGGTPLTSASVASGQATVPLSNLAPGLHKFTGSYSGDPNHAAGTTPELDATVVPADVDLGLTCQSPVLVGTNSICQITASAHPPSAAIVQGTDFCSLDGGAGIAGTIANGQGTCSVPIPTAGPHSITCNLTENADFNFVAASPANITATPPVPTQFMNSQLRFTGSGLVYSRVSQTFKGTLTATNISGGTLNGPFQFVLTGLPQGVTLKNADGMLNGNPFIRVPSVSTLAPGQSATVNLEFINLSFQKVPITYVPQGFKGL